MRRATMPQFARQATGVGGGAPPLPAQPLDPAGLVPVNRTQPVATDGGEAQRLLERRLGSMPPASFSGAGAGFVPVGRPLTTSYADGATDMARMEMANNPGITQGPPLSVASTLKARMALLRNPQTRAAGMEAMRANKAAVIDNYDRTMAQVAEIVTPETRMGLLNYANPFRVRSPWEN